MFNFRKKEEIIEPQIEKKEIKYKYKVGQKVFHIKDYAICEDNIVRLTRNMFGSYPAYHLKKEYESIAFNWRFDFPELQLFSTKLKAEKELKKILRKGVAKRMEAIKEAAIIIDKTLNSSRLILIETAALKEELGILISKETKLK